MKKLEDRYVVIKKEGADAETLKGLLHNLKRNDLEVVEAIVCESSWGISDHVRNLILYGTVEGPELQSFRELESETITVEDMGTMKRTVTERWYREPKTENRLETKIEIGSNVNAEMLAAALDASVPAGTPPRHVNVSPEPFAVDPVPGVPCAVSVGYMAQETAGPAPAPSHQEPLILDSAMYVHYLKSDNVTAMLRIEEKHLLVGYPPEQVLIGLHAIEQGKDPIYTINCTIEKDNTVPQPIMPPPAAPPIGIPPAAPQVATAKMCTYPGCFDYCTLGSSYYCTKHVCMAPAPTPDYPQLQPGVAYCGEPGCAASPVEGEAHCAKHSAGYEEAAPAVEPVVLPEVNKPWNGEPVAELPASDESEGQLPDVALKAPNTCLAATCKRYAREGSDYCHRHQPKE